MELKDTSGVGLVLLLEQQKCFFFFLVVQERLILSLLDSNISSEQTLDDLSGHVGLRIGRTLDVCTLVFSWGKLKIKTQLCQNGHLAMVTS